MNAILKLVRPEIRNLRPYRAAEFKDGMVRLNADETPWRPSGDESTTGLNLYPDSRPLALTDRLARHYDLEVVQLLVTRGSSEAIDLLVRCFCREGQDDIVICPPTFGMYSFTADSVAWRDRSGISEKSSVFRVPKKLSATALSQQFARRLILQVIAAASNARR